MTETIHNTAWELFDAVMTHAKEHGSTIIRTDDPKRLLIGWGCPESDSYHYVRLASLKTRSGFQLPFEDEELYKWITECFRTQEGRDIITTALNSDDDSVLSSFKRMLKLKAFW